MDVLLRRAFSFVLQAGGTPEHVAFVMDGNRRFAEREQVDRAAGHAQGYYKVGLSPGLRVRDVNQCHVFARWWTSSIGAWSSA